MMFKHLVSAFCHGSCPDQYNFSCFGWSVLIESIQLDLLYSPAGSLLNMPDFFGLSKFGINGDFSQGKSTVQRFMLAFYETCRKATDDCSGCASPTGLRGPSPKEGTANAWVSRTFIPEQLMSSHQGYQGCCWPRMTTK